MVPCAILNRCYDRLHEMLHSTEQNDILLNVEGEKERKNEGYHKASIPYN